MPRPATPLPVLLKSRLSEARRTIVLAVGSALRGDDAAGLLVGAGLRRRLGSRRPRGMRVVFGDTAPENLTGELRRYAPTHLVVIDAADLGAPPGTTRLVEPAELRETRVCTTHQVPLTVLLAYLQESLPCQVVIVGIQPGDVGFGAPVSAAVRRSARRLASQLLTALGLEPRRERGRGTGAGSPPPLRLPSARRHTPVRGMPSFQPRSRHGAQQNTQLRTPHGS